MSSARIKRKRDLHETSQPNKQQKTTETIVGEEKTVESRPKKNALIKQPSTTQNLAETKGQKRKKIKRDDKAYRPGGNKKKTGDTLAMRCDNRKTVESENSQESLRTSFMIDTSQIQTKTPLSPRKLSARMNAPTTTECGSYRRIYEVVEVNVNQSPVKVKVFSPTKNDYAELTRDTKIGPVSLFSNRSLVFSSENDAISELDTNHPFYQSEQYKKIKQYLYPSKDQELEITSTLLKKTANENAKNNFRRVKDQRAVMNGSATKYATATDLFVEGLKWEWLHLVAHEIAGAESQCIDNLVAGTYHANTNMIFVERELAFLAKHYPQGFTLKVTAHLMESKDTQQNDNDYLQIGTKLEYTIATDDFTIPFVFNTQNPIQPHLDYKHYMRAMFQALIDLIEEKETLQKTDEASNQAEQISHCYKK